VSLSIFTEHHRHLLNKGDVIPRLDLWQSDLLPENWSGYYESPTVQTGQKEDSR
jgi:hypothetical protein